ncbi:MULTISPECIES: acyl-CoA dehydrogenase family protein [Pseudonocardia]|uniref:acyl-CoA dehydrogenase family protein n=1 Tax=Pseudonocardia sp. SID8383 TaxID=2690363 RepID=UPI001926BDD9|nr:acyl-CoA dehydrogenase family protein [Pseudonocardia sp. SID8383]
MTTVATTTSTSTATRTAGGAGETAMPASGAETAMPASGAEIGVSARVSDYTARFAEFLAREVAPLEKELTGQGAGTPSQPRFDEKGRMSAAVWEARREVQRRAGAAGLYAPHTSAEVGGGGFGRVEMHHVEEFVYRRSGLGLGLAALAWTEGPNPAVEHCSPALREQYLTPLITGEITAAFCNTEFGAGSDVLRMATHAERDGSDWVINGSKGWITNSHFADVLQVVAVTDAGAGTRSLSMFLVDGNAPGVTRGVDLPTTMADGLTGALEFTDVRVPAENVVGEIGDGFGLAMSWINWRRLCRGGMCAGWGAWLLERAVDYAQQREVGGKPIADQQVVQHMLANMHADIYQARATSLVAQAELDVLGPYAKPLHRDAPRLISLVKVINDEAFFRVADTAVQVRGAAGLIQDSPEEKLFRVARNLRIPAGTSEIQRNAIARGLLRSRAA